MKKLYTTLLIIGAAISSSAQIETSMGFKGGMIVNQFHGDNLKQQAWKTGPQVGGYMNLSLANISQFQFELLYQRQRGSFVSDLGEFDLRTGYIEIPLLYKLRYPSKKGIYPYLSIGQSVGYKISESSRIHTTESEGTFKEAANQVKSINVNTLVGAGVDFESDNVNLFVDARYVNGNINISKQDYAVKSRSFALTIGLGFKLNK